MRKSRYSDGQIVCILRETDSLPIAEVAKRHGVSDASIYARRKRFDEMVSDDVKRLKGKRPARPTCKMQMFIL
ncbi:transposase [Robbsia andropogonis]|uniref:transposase n=1 Tax=Robbsia andropogonis TaxID=28092 RepID=UPI0004653CAF